MQNPPYTSDTPAQSDVFEGEHRKAHMWQVTFTGPGVPGVRVLPLWQQRDLDRVSTLALAGHRSLDPELVRGRIGAASCVLGAVEWTGSVVAAAII